MVKKISLEINFTNKWFYTFITFGVIIFLSIVVYAYNSPSPNPSIMGHSADEIEGVCLTNGTGCPSMSALKTKDFYCGTSWQLVDGELSCGVTASTVEPGAWTGESGDCSPDSWSNTPQTISCPANYRRVAVEIRRQVNWDGGAAWIHDTGWKPNTATWNARTSIVCDEYSCNYNTKGVAGSEAGGPQWSSISCGGVFGGDQWYSRLQVRITCNLKDSKENY